MHGVAAQLQQACEQRQDVLAQQRVGVEERQLEEEREEVGLGLHFVGEAVEVREGEGEEGEEETLD